MLQILVLIVQTKHKEDFIRFEGTVFSLDRRILPADPST